MGTIEKYGTIICKGGEPIQITGFTFAGYPNIMPGYSVVIDALQWAADKILAKIEDAVKSRETSKAIQERCVCADYKMCLQYDCLNWATKAANRQGQSLMHILLPAPPPGVSWEEWRQIAEEILSKDEGAPGGVTAEASEKTCAENHMERRADMDRGRLVTLLSDWGAKRKALNDLEAAIGEIVLLSLAETITVGNVRATCRKEVKIELIVAVSDRG